MTSVNEWHEQAMSAADEGDAARRRGDDERARDSFRQALVFERKAIEGVEQAVESNKEPTRSILYRSAAALAYDAQEFFEAEHLILHALIDSTQSNTVPPEIIQELRELLLRIYAEWGISLNAEAG